MAFEETPRRGKEAAGPPVARIPIDPTGGGAPGPGFRSGATGPVAQGHLAAATAAGATLGEPGGFKGPAAPAIPVIRGMTTTYKPGGQFDLPEVATPEEARMATNQAAGVGVFRGTRQTVEEIKAKAQVAAAEAKGSGLSKLAEAQAKLINDQAADRERAEKGTLFKGQWENLYGPFPKEGTKAHQMANDAMLHEMEHPGQGMARYRENLQINDQEPLFTPENLTGVQKAYPNEKIPTPEHLAVLKQNPDIWRQTVLHYGSYLQQLLQQRQQAEGAAVGVTNETAPWYMAPAP